MEISDHRIFTANMTLCVSCYIAVAFKGLWVIAQW